MAVPASQPSDFAIRPAEESLLAIVAVATVWSGLVAAALIFVGGVLWPATVNAALMAALVLGAWRAKGANRLFERDGTIFHHRGLGRPRAIVSAGDGTRIVRVREPHGTMTMDFWLGPDGRARFRTTDRWWQPADLRQLWARIGIAEPPGVEVMDLDQAMRRYPDTARSPSGIFAGTSSRDGAATASVPACAPVPAVGIASPPVCGPNIVRPVGGFGDARLTRLVPVAVAAALIGAGGYRSPALAAAVVAVAVLLIAAGEFDARRGAALLFDGRTLVLRGSLGRLRAVAARGETIRVVRVKVQVAGRVVVRQLWIDAAGMCRASLNERTWDPDALDAIRTQLALPLEEGKGTQRAADLNRRHPGATAWTEAHPIATVGAVGVVFFGGISSLLLLFDLLTR